MPCSLIHSETENDVLHLRCEKLKNIKSHKIASVFETMKLSALHNRSYSLSSNQIGLNFRLFVMHNNVKDGLWVYPERGK